MKQISAVEWLFQELWETPQDKFRWHTILEQAKEMEKEQKIIDYEMGYISGGNQKSITGEQYYNEIYGGNK
jgi:hypothetical protein